MIGLPNSTLLLGHGLVYLPFLLPLGCIVVSNSRGTSGSMTSSSFLLGCDVFRHRSLLLTYVDHPQAFNLLFSILFIILGQLGGCRHLYYLEMNPAQAIKALRINWISQPPMVIALVMGKISASFVIMRIMGRSKWRKAFLIYVAIIGSVVICGIAIAFTFAQCRPVEALWNPRLLASGRATCWPPHIDSDFQLFTGSMCGSFSLCGQS